MADIKAQLKTKNGDNLYPVTSMAYVTATFNGGLSFDSSTNTLSTYQIPIASVYALTTSLSAKQAKCSAGFRTEINGATVSQKRYFDIASNVSSGSLTLSAGQAYRIFATGNVVTLNAESFTTTQFGLEGHATILVTNNSYLTLGSNVVLGTPLANDAVNNCTLRFHDGHCIIDVEDHDAAHTVTVATGTGSGTLYYYCSAANTTTNETPQYISISDALDGGLVSFNGVSVNGEKHIVGNGIERTSLTSSFTPSSKTYITHAAFSGLTAVTGGTVYATDCAVAAGGAATFSSPLYAYEKLTVNGTLNVPGRLMPGNGLVVSGNGGSINFGYSYVAVSSGVSMGVSGISLVSGGIPGTNTGGFVVTSGGEMKCTDCTITGFSANAFVFASLAKGSVELTGCTVYGNAGTGALAKYVISLSQSTLTVSACTFESNQDIVFTAGATPVNSVTLAGSNAMKNAIYPRSASHYGFVNISSGAVLDFTNNANAVVINPGTSGHVIVDGGCTVINSAGTFVHINGGTYTKINKDGTTA